jgi:sulfite exporter TauE/SafE
VDAALVTSAALLGLAGTPHCAAMCAAPCAAVCGGRGAASTVAFQLARVAGYSAAGAVVATSVGALASLSQWTPALRPLWVLLHLAFLSLGLWMAVVGRQPTWMGAVGRQPQAVQPLPSAGWSPMRGPVQAAAAGGLWVAWPCGLLQSALLVASLTSGPQAGAGAMAAFALASSGGLLAAPWLWQQLKTRTGLPTWERWLVRIAGACLVLGSGFSLGHGVWPQVAAFCGWT